MKKNEGSFSSVVEMAQLRAYELGESQENFWIGSTEGQIFDSRNPKAPKMTKCWLSIETRYDHKIGRHQVFLMPLVSGDTNYRYRCSEEFLKTVTDPHHRFGGETVLNRHFTAPYYRMNKPIEPQVKALTIATYPAVKQHIYEHCFGDLVLRNGTYFSFADDGGYLDEHNCFIRKHRGTKLWYEPSHEYLEENCDPLGNNYSDFDLLVSESADTGDIFAVVPTIWIKGTESNECDCFLSFNASWRPSKLKDRLTSRIGDFVVTHFVLGNGELSTRTSLRECESLYHQEQAI